MANFSEIKDKALGFVGGITKHWKRPAVGQEVPYGEYLNYGIGGMGVQFILVLTTCFTLNAGNTLLGTCLGIQPTHLQLMLAICTLSNFVFLYLRGFVFDNIRSKLGKFRPIILMAAIPLVVVSVIFLVLPVDRMIYNYRVILVFTFAFLIQMIVPYLQESVAGIGYVISTKSSERANIISVYSIIYSLAPTITGMIIPMLTSLIPGGYSNIDAYRYINIPISIVGIGLCCFAVFGTKERIIKPKNYVPKTNTLKAMGEVFKNKYWWIRNFAGWFSFLEGASVNIFAWLFIYGSQDLVAQGLVNTVMGTSALIAMVGAPFLLRKIGNKKILLLNNFANILLLLGMLVFRNMAFVFAILLYFNRIADGLAIIYNPVIDAEIRDYQQYVSNKRVDGVFAAATMINIPILIAGEFIVAFAYKCFGLTSNYGIMYDSTVRNAMFAVLLTMSVIGALANFIPFLFYSYPREMHKSIVRTIRLRTLFTDYVDKKLSPDLIKVAIEEYEEVMAIVDKESANPEELKQALITAKAMSKAIKEAQLELKAQINAMPNGTAEEKLARKNAVEAMNATLSEKKNERAVAIKTAKKAIEEDNVLLANKKYLQIYLDEFNKHNDNSKVVEYRMSKMAVELGLEKLALLKEEEVDALVAKVVDESDVISDEKVEAQIKKFTDNLKSMVKKMQKAYPKGFVMPDLDAIDNANLLPETTKEETKTKTDLLKELLKERKVYDTCTAFFEDMSIIVKRFDGGLFFDDIRNLYPDACAQVKAQEEAEIKAEEERKQELKNKLNINRKKKSDDNNSDEAVDEKVKDSVSQESAPQAIEETPAEEPQENTQPDVDNKEEK
ncbi:MAG: MFS transporter [Clostridia bacterium]